MGGKNTPKVKTRTFYLDLNFCDPQVVCLIAHEEGCAKDNCLGLNKLTEALGERLVSASPNSAPWVRDEPG